MGNIIVYNHSQECHTSEKNNYSICSGSVLANPFTVTGKRTNVMNGTFRTYNECMNAYGVYFDRSMELNPDFRKAIDLLYIKYKNGEDIYLEGDSVPNPCHGEVIAKKIKEMVVRDKIRSLRKNKQ